MKSKSLLAILLVAAVSCGKDGSLTTDQPSSAEAGYVGTMTVEYLGEAFDNENISVKFTPSESGTTADITIYQIKFVPQMPVTIDVTIPSVTVSAASGTISFSGDNIVPWALGGEMPRYLVTGLSGRIEGKEISFSLSFGDYPTRFSGREQVQE